MPARFVAVFLIATMRLGQAVDPGRNALAIWKWKNRRRGLKPAATEACLTMSQSSLRLRIRNQQAIDTTFSSAATQK
jgi:hypothetical protein